MSVARVTEVCASSPVSFDDAVAAAVQRAAATLENITGAWISDRYVKVTAGRISEYRVRLRISFLLHD
ncbi:MAG: dodecin family protein [Bryobacteraceae bacterium]